MNEARGASFKLHIAGFLRSNDVSNVHSSHKQAAVGGGEQRLQISLWFLTAETLRPVGHLRDKAVSQGRQAAFFLGRTRKTSSRRELGLRPRDSQVFAWEEPASLPGVLRSQPGGKAPMPSSLHPGHFAACAWSWGCIHPCFTSTFLHLSPHLACVPTCPAHPQPITRRQTGAL